MDSLPWWNFAGANKMIFRYSAATTPRAEDGAKISLLVVWNINVLYNNAEKYNLLLVVFVQLRAHHWGRGAQKKINKGSTSQLRWFVCLLQLRQNWLAWKPFTFLFEAGWPLKSYCIIVFTFAHCSRNWGTTEWKYENKGYLGAFRQAAPPCLKFV